MRWVVQSLIAALIVIIQPPVRAQTDDAHLPVSIERIRAALQQQPSLLRVSASSDDMPTFRVDVTERLPILKPVEEEPFDPTFGLPSAGELLADGIGEDPIRGRQLQARSC
jgi:hypothetical protein